MLEDDGWPVIARNYPHMTTSSKNLHRARSDGSVMEYGLRNKIKTLTWPSQPPDLNVIENVRYRLKRQ